MSVTIDHVFRWWGSEQGERTALVFGDRRVSYATLNAWVGRVASEFAQAGVGVGERVTIYAANSLEYCVAALACLRCGGIITGLNNRMVTPEVMYLLGDYAPAVLITDEECAARLPERLEIISPTGEPVKQPVRISISEIGASRQGDPADIRREVDPNSPAVIVTTSGSTARPKGVMWSNRTIIDYNHAYSLEDPLDVAHPKLLVVAPFSTSAGLVQFLQAILMGGTAYLAPKFDAAEALATIATERITIFCGAPIFFQRIAELPAFAGADVASIQIAQTGGAAVDPKLLKLWADKGVLVRQIYGQTECGGTAVANPRRFALTHPECCGHGGALRDVAIIGPGGEFLPQGEVGQIVLRGPGVMLGYWNNPKATAEVLVDGWLRTGDLGVFNELGLLRFVDRAKDMIISGGLNVSAAEVERVIMEYAGVSEVAVLSAPDPVFSETPFAVVYGDERVTVQALFDHCRQNLSSYKLPRYIELREEPLPRLATGKISKVAIRKLYPMPEKLPQRIN